MGSDVVAFSRDRFCGRFDVLGLRKKERNEI